MRRHLRLVPPPEPAPHERSQGVVQRGLLTALGQQLYAQDLGYYLDLEEHGLRLLDEGVSAVAQDLARGFAREGEPVDEAIVAALERLARQELPHQVTRVNTAIRRAQAMPVPQYRLLARCAVEPTRVDSGHELAVARALKARGLISHREGSRYARITALGRHVFPALREPTPQRVEVHRGRRWRVFIDGVFALSARVLDGERLVDHSYGPAARITDEDWRTIFEELRR